jgi:hypothetical protein
MVGNLILYHQSDFILHKTVILIKHFHYLLHYILRETTVVKDEFL